MQTFIECTDVFKNISDKYKKSGEIDSVSLPIEFENKLYREIVYRDSIFGKPRKGIKGILVVSEDGEVIKDNRVIKEILSLGYYLELLFNDSNLHSLTKALAKERDIEKEKREYEEMISTFDDLKDQGVSNLENLRGMLLKLPELKRDNNEAIQCYLDNVGTYNNEGFVFTKEVMNSTLSLYRDVLLKNVQKVKYVNKGRYYFEDIKVGAHKLRKKYKWRLIGRGGIEPLARLENLIGFFKRMLEVYEQVLNLNDAQYLRYIQNSESQNIEERLKLIRE